MQSCRADDRERRHTSLLERLFDEEQRSSLGDMIQAALMLVYNERNVG